MMEFTCLGQTARAVLVAIYIFAHCETNTGGRRFIFISTPPYASKRGSVDLICGPRGRCAPRLTCYQERGVLPTPKTFFCVGGGRSDYHIFVRILYFVLFCSLILEIVKSTTAIVRKVGISPCVSSMFWTQHLLTETMRSRMPSPLAKVDRIACNLHKVLLCSIHPLLDLSLSCNRAFWASCLVAFYGFFTWLLNKRWFAWLKYTVLYYVYSLNKNCSVWPTCVENSGT
jgi:hypothetical protein